MFVNAKRKHTLKEFLKSINISFRNYELLNLALSHRSYSNEQKMSSNNERLEFLGDSILGFVITEYLYSFYSECKEGDLAKIKSFVISENSLSKIAQDIKFNKYLLIGKGEEASGGRNKKTIISDAFEAFLASYYLDSNFKKTKDLIVRLFKNEINLVYEDRHEKDYKTLLQELVQKKHKACPKYRLRNKKGPEHNRIFFMEVMIGEKVFGIGEGKSKKDAEKLAAKNAYYKIVSPHMESSPKKRKVNNNKFF